LNRAGEGKKDMKSFSNLQYQVNALRKSKRCSQKQAEQLTKHLSKLKHSLDIGNKKQAKIHMDLILQVIVELLKL